MWTPVDVPDRLHVQVHENLFIAAAVSGTEVPNTNMQLVLPASTGRSLEANWQQAAGLVQSPILSSSSDGSNTTLSTQPECPSISPIVKDNVKPLPLAAFPPAGSSTLTINTSNCFSPVSEKREIGAISSSDCWPITSGEYQISPWPCHYQQSAALHDLSRNRTLAQLEGAETLSTAQLVDALAATSNYSTICVQAQFQPFQKDNIAISSTSEEESFNRSDPITFNTSVDIRRSLESSSSKSAVWSVSAMNMLSGLADLNDSAYIEYVASGETLPRELQPNPIHFLQSTQSAFENCNMQKITPDEIQGLSATQPCYAANNNIHSDTLYSSDTPAAFQSYANTKEDFSSGGLMDVEMWPNAAIYDITDEQHSHIRSMVASISSAANLSSPSETYTSNTDSLKFYSAPVKKIKQSPEINYNYVDRTLSMGCATAISGNNEQLLTQSHYKSLLQSLAGRFELPLPRDHSFHTHAYAADQMHGNQSRLTSPSTLTSPTSLLLRSVIPYAASAQSTHFGNSISGTILGDNADSRSDHPQLNSPKYIPNEADEDRESRPVDVQNEKKRSQTVESSSCSEESLKKPRLSDQAAPSSLPPLKPVRKEKLGEKITALQQLVSPFGKTDTASVLFEAIGYIRFLHDQVQVLSKPYMKTVGISSRYSVEAQKTSSWAPEIKKLDAGAEENKSDLRSRGLCLVPVSCTEHIANDNGADYWTPPIGTSSR